MKILNKINNCLNNEYGGPNVEMLIGIGIALAVGVALYALGGTIHGAYSNITTYLRLRTNANAEI